MSRKPALTSEDAEQLYLEYCAWQDAVRRLHPKKLMAKYGISQKALVRYGRREHKTRRIA